MVSQTVPPPPQFKSALKEPLLASTGQLHLDAANNVQKFFMNFVVLDMLTAGALYQRIWITSSCGWWDHMLTAGCGTSLKVVAATATLTFIIDIIFAVFVLLFFRGYESRMDRIGDWCRWWENPVKLIRANVVSNSLSLLALTVYQIMCSGWKRNLLIFASGCMLIRAAKYRPIFLLHKQLASALKGDDKDPNRYSMLFDYWVVERSDTSKKWLVKVVLVSLATIVAGLAAAACWDAMQGKHMHGNHTAVSGNEQPLSHATPWIERGTESSLALTAMDAHQRKPMPLHLSTPIDDGVADTPGGTAYGPVQDFSPSGRGGFLSWWNAKTPISTCACSNGMFQPLQVASNGATPAAGMAFSLADIPCWWKCSSR